ncbi:MAG: GntR family transcriptional regulator [Cytophagales bacterium]|nr:GntR family transcriptional regulator [Cytophagales bacterium]
MTIGQYHTLRLDRITPPGAYLTNGETNVLLPTKYIPKDAKVDDELRVFVYRDSEDRIICTTLTPNLVLNQFGYLRVKDVSSVGAFLDWGIEKDLLVPFREQVGRLDVGQWILVYLYTDEKSDRVVATSKVSRFYETVEIDLEEGQEVDLLISNTTDLGLNVVINDTYQGLIYANDIFHDLLEGDRMKGYVKTIRADRKIDVSLRQTGLENLESGATQILEALKKNEGYLPLHDKSDPTDIQLELQMSKKNFKRSVGVLYKKKLIQLQDEGIRLV